MIDPAAQTRMPSWRFVTMEGAIIASAAAPATRVSVMRSVGTEDVARERGEGIMSRQSTDHQDDNTQRSRGDLQAPLESEWTVASAAHAAILVTVGLGPAVGIGFLMGPAIVLAIFLAYRARSEFVSRHAVQALVYQLAGGGVLGLLGGMAVAASSAAWGIGSSLSESLPGGTTLAAVLPFTLILAALLISSLLGWMAYGLYVALQVYQGRDYRYWLIGNWVNRRSRDDEES